MCHIFVICVVVYVIYQFSSSLSIFICLWMLVSVSICTVVLYAIVNSFGICSEWPPLAKAGPKGFDIRTAISSYC